MRSHPRSIRAAGLALAILGAGAGPAAAQDRPAAADSAALLYRQAKALHALGGAANQDSAVRLLVRAVALYDSYGAASSGAHVLNDIGAIHLEAARLDSARHYLVWALRIYGHMNRWETAGPTLLNLGHVARRLGQPDTALVAYRTAAALGERYGDPAVYAAATHGFGSSWADLEQPDSAIPYYRLALSAFRAQGERPSEADVLTDLAHAINERGDAVTALALLREALAIYQEICDVEGEQHVRFNIVQLERQRAPRK